MNINFDDTNLVVSNIQAFLKEEIDPMIVLSGTYDTSTHAALVKYLKKPNTADMYEMRDYILDKFTYKQTYAPYEIYDGGGIINFDIEFAIDRLRFYTRPTQTHYNNGVAFVSDHIQELAELCEEHGWKLDNFSYNKPDITQSGRNRVEINIKQAGIKNRFPNKDVLPMVNLFTGKYLYKKCITASDRFEGFIQYHDNYKLAYVECNSGDTFTIAHGFAIPCEMAAGYVTCSSSQLKEENTQVINVSTHMSFKGQVVKPGDYFYYEVPEDSNATYLIIQLPYSDQLTVAANQTNSILLGDVNQDGVVNSADVSLLDSYVTAIENNQTPSVTLEGAALIAANVTRNLDLDGNPVISRDDVNVLRNAVENNKTDELGTYEYEITRRVSQYELDRLLVMNGELAKDDDLNIPVSQFWLEPWAVHSEFIKYFLGRVINPYSDAEDIIWLQKNIQTLYPNYKLLTLGKYDTEDDYTTEFEIKRNNITGLWEYLRFGTATGYYLPSSSDGRNGILLYGDGKESSMKLINGNIYDDNWYTGNTVSSSGKVVKDNALNSLKACVKSFQKEVFGDIHNNSQSSFWTIGYYNVDTDEAFMKALSGDVRYDVSAFR